MRSNLLHIIQLFSFYSISNTLMINPLLTKENDCDFVLHQQILFSFLQYDEWKKNHTFRVYSSWKCKLLQFWL